MKKPAGDGTKMAQFPKRQNWIVPNFQGIAWLPDLDLNQDKQIQSLLCYRYTIRQSPCLQVITAILFTGNPRTHSAG